jgi:multidrug efflux pump subunit AcrA (membrane-fusion protein)
MGKLKGKNNNLIILFSICLMLTVAFGCSRKEDTRKETMAIPVKVQKVELLDLSDTIEYIADVKAQDEALVYPKVSGKIIEKSKQDGEAINKNEAICYIDRDETGLKFERAPVESPISGVVGRIYVDLGVNVTPQTAIGLVVNMDKVKATLDIPEKYLPKISLGQEARVRIDAYPQEEFLGRVSKISPVLNTDTRSAPVEITVDNTKHLIKSGMFGRVSLALEVHKSVPAVLREAIIGRDPDIYVYVVENNKAILKKVSIGISQGPYYEVKELKEGDRVVVMGQQRLFENAAVVAEDNNK